MKVLQIWSSPYAGGGGVTMRRLHDGFKKAGLESRLLCSSNPTGSSEISVIPRRRRLEKLLKLCTSNLGLNDIHCISTFKLRKNEDYLNADIVQLQGIHSGFFNYLALPSLTKNKPVVFVIGDMWPFTGHCAVAYDCDRWKIGCGKCPYPDANPAIKRDGTRLEWKLKNWAYGRSRLTLVTKSNWATEVVKESMLRRFPVYLIPNGIDTELYKPLDRSQCRAFLGIAKDTKVLMFTAGNLANQAKGADLLVKAIEELPDSLKAKTVLLMVGRNGEVVRKSLSIQAINFGYVESDRLKRLCYCAADVFVHPTRAENFGLVLLESMACGTPIVSFNVGGVCDTVRPGITGYLAEAEDARALGRGIVELLEDENTRRGMSKNCREIVIQEYTLDLEITRYVKLYQELLDKPV